MLWFQSSGDAIWQRKSLAPNLMSIPAATTSTFPAMWRAMLGDVEEFITGHREISSIDLDRVLATVLFTDIVDSTRSAAEMGDQTWRRLLDSHDEVAREMVEKHRGTLIKTTGDGILATFDGPGRSGSVCFGIPSSRQANRFAVTGWCAYRRD